MTIKISTGLRDVRLSSASLRDTYNRGCSKILIYNGAAPASPDDAVTGTLLCTITNGSATVKAKQKIRFTPTPGTAVAAEWNITLNGVKFTFVDDGTAAVAEICTGLYNLIRAAIDTTSITTPPGKLNIPAVYGKFTLTDNATSLDIEAATAGDSFDYTTTVTGAGAGTGAVATSVVTADAYGLQFETDADAISGILEKLSTQTWSGAAVASGVASYFRHVLDSDSGTLSTSEPRIQGSVGTAGADLNFNTVNFVLGATYSISTYPVTDPES